MSRLLATAAGAAVLLISSPAFSETGRNSGTSPGAELVHFTFDGVLRTPDGKPLTGRQRVAFALFRGGTGHEADSGTLIYGETLELELSSGQAVHAVGTGTPTFGRLDPSALTASGLASEEALWLQVSVGDDQRPVLPRTRLQTAPSAASAQDAQRLGGLPAEAYVRAGDLAKAVQAVVRSTAGVMKAAGTGYLSFIGGGQNQDASGGMSAIAGGTDNHATWWAAFIGGGSFNWATGAYSTVAGGLGNAAINDRSTVGGGFQNRAEGLASVVSGGANNQATGHSSTVPGGQLNTASGLWSFAAGRRAKAQAQGAFVWADSQDEDFVNSTADSVAIRAKGGVLIENNGFSTGLTVNNTNGGTAVRGTSKSSMGVWGVAATISSAGVIGDNTGGGEAVVGRTTGGNGVGAVVGRNDGGGPGVRGFNTKTGYGVHGQAGISGGTGVGGRFENLNTENSSDGLQGATNGSGAAIRATNTGTGVALYAEAASGDLINARSTNPANLRFRVTNSGNVTADGTFSSPAADFAEMLPAVDGLEPGDVLVIGPDGRLARSTQPNQTTVAGVYSTRPAFLGGQGDDADPAGKVPLGVVGVLPTKVTDENGPIAPGDILVSSSTPGHAMKAGPDRPADTSLGKALAPLASGTGVIPVLVTTR